MTNVQPYYHPVIHRHTRRCNNHDYSDRGIYMLTFVVKDRRPILGTLLGPSSGPSCETSTLLGPSPGPSCETSIRESSSPRVHLSPIGEAVEREFLNIPAHYPQISIISQQVMPDHWHGLLFVKETLPSGLDKVISGFKGGCSRAMWALYGKTDEGLFEKGYNDGIVWRKGQLDKYKRYITDNPRRAWIRKTHPDIMRRCLHIQIDGRDYAAFGNIFLLRKPDKQQIFCHRLEPECSVPPVPFDSPVRQTFVRRPYELTEAFANEREHWLAAARQGVVTVTPGISKGEQILKADCLKERLPLIHIQKDPIGPYWKPEESRFNACAEGSLLILAPWSLTEMGETHKTLTNGTKISIAADSDYSQFHNLNTLAAELCAFDGEARIIPLSDAHDAHPQ